MYNLKSQKFGFLLIGSTMLLTGCLSSDDSTKPLDSSNQISSAIELSSELVKSSVMLGSSFEKSSEFSPSSSLNSSMSLSSMNISSIAKSSSSLSSTNVSSISKISSVVSSSSSGVIYGSFTDTRDNQVYKTVVIGTQTWMAQNLNYGAYISDSNSGSTYQSGAQKFCYGNIASNCDTDGGLYQWHTSMGFASNCATTSCAGQISTGNHQGICPVGWHVPKAIEWNVLQTYLGGSTVVGSKMKLNNTGNSSWDASSYNDGNSSGFSAQPSGFRNNYGVFYDRGYDAYFWEIAEYNESRAYYRDLDGRSSVLIRSNDYKSSGLSVRCARD